MEYDFSELPEEIQRLYLLKLPVKDIANYCAVNPSVHKICVDDYFWLLKVDHDFHVYEYKPKDITYQQQFLDLLSITDPNIAAERGRMDILLYLESQGKLPNKIGANLAVANNHIAVVNWLETKGISPDRCIYCQSHKVIGIVKQLRNTDDAPSTYFRCYQCNGNFRQ